MKQALRLGLFLVCLGALPVNAWWSEDWAFRKTIDLDPAAIGLITPQQSVPVLVRLHVGNFAYFADVAPDGKDLRFVAGDDVTPLSYFVEKFDPLGQIGLIWVQVPSILPGVPDQKIFMYYGNSEAPSGAQSSQVFDREYVGVLPFRSTDPGGDVTAYGNRGQMSQSAVEPQGFIGDGLRFNPGEALRLPATPSLAILPDRGFSWSAWLRLDQSQSDSTLLELKGPDGDALRIDISGSSIELVGISDGLEPRKASSAAPLTLAAWHHIAMTIRGNEARAYVDGQESARLSPLPQRISGSVVVGNTAQGDRSLSEATLDEIRFSNTARSREWFAMNVSSQGMGSNFLFLGEDSQRDDSGHESHLVTTLRNVDWAGLEGIVVFVCMFMAVVTWFLMGSKGIEVSRIRNQNDRFLAQYYAADADSELSVDSSTKSTVEQLYALGVSEIEKRLMPSGSVGAAAVSSISQESMMAIRATLTASNVRVSQRLNNLMVLLTLAIAGGPFLGLLGTVVGVMVTFAGIAASGDVNINAIAPGIAAALVATVAGLIVAIPALFGYNYISSRIKEVITENNVFVEEFMATVAEEYS